MSAFIIGALAAIGIGAGAILYHNYFRNSEGRVKGAARAEMPVSISFSTSADSPVMERIDRKEKPERKKAPINAACGVCKETSMLPFRCKFCSSLYCGEHRLPESHNCESL